MTVGVTSGRIRPFRRSSTGKNTLERELRDGSRVIVDADLPEGAQPREANRWLRNLWVSTDLYDEVARPDSAINDSTSTT